MINIIKETINKVNNLLGVEDVVKYEGEKVMCYDPCISLNNPYETFEDVYKCMDTLKDNLKDKLVTKNLNRDDVKNAISELEKYSKWTTKKDRCQVMGYEFNYNKDLNNQYLFLLHEINEDNKAICSVGMITNRLLIGSSFKVVPVYSRELKELKIYKSSKGYFVKCNGIRQYIDNLCKDDKRLDSILDGNFEA